MKIRINKIKCYSHRLKIGVLFKFYTFAKIWLLVSILTLKCVSFAEKSLLIKDISGIVRWLKYKGMLIEKNKMDKQFEINKNRKENT